MQYLWKDEQIDFYCYFKIFQFIKMTYYTNIQECF